MFLICFKTTDNEYANWRSNYVFKEIVKNMKFDLNS